MTRVKVLRRAPQIIIIHIEYGHYRAQVFSVRTKLFTRQNKLALFACVLAAQSK